MAAVSTCRHLWDSLMEQYRLGNIPAARRYHEQWEACQDRVNVSHDRVPGQFIRRTLREHVRSDLYPEDYVGPRSLEERLRENAWRRRMPLVAARAHARAAASAAPRASAAPAPRANGAPRRQSAGTRRKLTRRKRGISRRH